MFHSAVPGEEVNRGQECIAVRGATVTTTEVADF